MGYYIKLIIMKFLLTLILETTTYGSPRVCNKTKMDALFWLCWHVNLKLKNEIY